MKPLVYIAGPYSQGDKEQNVRNAIDAAELVLRKGGTPYIPHLTHYWDQVYPKDVRFWYNYDREFLRFCHFLVIIPGPSVGVDMEIDIAHTLGMEIYSIAYLEATDFMFSTET